MIDDKIDDVFSLSWLFTSHSIVWRRDVTFSTYSHRKCVYKITCCNFAIILYRVVYLNVSVCLYVCVYILYRDETVVSTVYVSRDTSRCVDRAPIVERDGPPGEMERVGS